MRYVITDKSGRKTIILVSDGQAHISYNGGKFVTISVTEAQEHLQAAQKAGKSIE